jgi:hypothetical protein
MPANTYEAISSFTLSSAVQYVNITNIPQNYTDLVVVIDSISTVGTYIRASFNGGANVSYVAAINNPSSPYTPSAFKGTGGFTGLAGGSNRNQVFFNFMNYSSNVNSKTYIGQTRQGVGGSYWGNTVGTIVTTNPLTSLSYHGDSGNVSAGSVISVYGLSANNLKATGGNNIQTDGTYWYHAFTSAGTFTPLSTLSCDVLVVGGGGGGGAQIGGGGGAGGVFYATSQSISTAQSVVIGAGGTGGVFSVSQGTNGTNSTFGSLTAGVGGGGGGSLLAAPGINGLDGGSGGGSGTNPTAGTAGTSIQTGTGGTGYGFAGGVGNHPAGGGGGGAGAVGGGAGGGEGGGGGAGLGTWSSWLNPTNLGVGGFIAGGGAGGSNSVISVAGGSGGGGSGGAGSGGVMFFPGSGMPNSGGGGGGTRDKPDTGESGGRGGSGLVIVRYAV